MTVVAKCNGNAALKGEQCKTRTTTSGISSRVLDVAHCNITELRVEKLVNDFVQLQAKLLLNYNTEALFLIWSI